PFSKHCFCCCLERVSSQFSKRGYLSTSFKLIVSNSFWINSSLTSFLEISQLQEINTKQQKSTPNLFINIPLKLKITIFYRIKTQRDPKIKSKNKIPRNLVK